MDAQRDLAGFQSEKRTMEAIPIRIDYQSLRFKHFSRPKGNDCLISFSTMKGQWNYGEIRQTTNLDPYAIRKRFVTVDSPEGAALFLSEAGQFWIWQDVLWSQFQEWQKYFEWLRLPRELAMRSQEGKKARLTAQGLGNQFFKVTDQEFTRARFHGAKLPPKDLRRNEVEDRLALWNLRRFAHFPGSSGVESRMSLAWYDPKDGHAPEDWKARRSTAPKGGDAKYEPYLRIETHYVLEAIAATIYVDRVNRLRYGKCKQCDRLFKIESDHGREFCPPPTWRETSPCKNAYLQHERRTTIDTLKNLFLEGWAKGLSESEIRRSWIAKRIEPTQKLISVAMEKARKQAKRQTRRSSR